MNRRIRNPWTLPLTACLVAGAGLMPASTGLGAAAPDWKAVAQALGKDGQQQDGGVFRVGFPRTDLKVTVEGIPVEPAFALGSYAAFKPTADGAMVMGDLVLRDDEVTPVMTGLLQGGLSVTALHNHLNGMSPHVMYLHYAGHGDAVRMATALRTALAASGTPLGTTTVAGPPAGSPGALDTRQIESILGRAGKMLSPTVFQVTVPRGETITEAGEALPPAMGVGMPFNFQATGDGRAASTGDFVLVASEVNAVARELRAHGIQVTALHNHGLADQPRLFYMHFWAHDDPVVLARGLRAALDRTNSPRTSR